MHTGSAFAGHYYAYLREICSTEATGNSFFKERPEAEAETDWIMFNDATVTRLDRNVLNDVLDRSPLRAVGSDNSGDSSTKQAVVRCPSNAYMLIYRGKNDHNVDSVPNDIIPTDLSAPIEKDNTIYLEKKAKVDYEKAFMHLQICFQTLTKLLRVHESLTVRQLTDMAVEAFQAHGKFEKKGGKLFTDKDTKVNQSSIVQFDLPRESVRLRAYDPIKNVVLPCADFGSDGNAVLKSFPDRIMNKVFRFEMISKSTVDFHEDFEQESCIEVNLHSYIPDNATFKSPINLMIPLSLTLKEVFNRGLIGTEATNGGSGSDHLNEIVVLDDITEEPQLLSADLPVSSCLRMGQDVFVSSGCYPKANIPSLLTDYFKNCHSSVTVKIKVPDSLTTEPDFSVSIGQHSSLKDLKDRLSCELNLLSERFSLHRYRQRLVSKLGVVSVTDRVLVPCKSIQQGEFTDIGPGEELKDLSVPVKSIVVGDQPQIEISVASPLLKEEFRVGIFVDLPIQESFAGTSTDKNITTLQYAGDLVVSSYDSVAKLKKIVSELSGISELLKAGNGNIRLRLGEVITSPVFSGAPQKPNTSAVNLFLFANSKPDDYVLKITNKILADECLLGDELNLVDGLCIVCQVNVPESVFLRGNVLINAQYWNIDDTKLKNFGDVVVAKDLSVRELKSQLCALLNTVNMGDREDGSRMLSLVRPFSWQLNDISSIPELKWQIQAADDSKISASPLRLGCGSVVLFADSNKLSIFLEEEKRAKSADGVCPDGACDTVNVDIYSSANSSAGFKNSIDSVFRILSVEDQVIAAKNNT